MRDVSPQRRLRTRTLGWLCAATAAILPLPARAQAPSPEWRFVTSADGLAESWVHDVTRGPSGRLHIAHGDIDRFSTFDGVDISTRPAPGRGLPVREAPDGGLWTILPVSQDGRPAGVVPVIRGLQRLEGERWVAYPFDRELPYPGPLDGFLPWAADRVVVVSGGDVFEFDRTTGRLTAVPMLAAAGGGFIGAVRAARDGGVWLGLPDAVVRVVPQPSGLPGVPDVRPLPRGSGAAVRHLYESATRRLVVTQRSRQGDGGEIDRVYEEAPSGWRTVTTLPVEPGRRLCGWPAGEGDVWIAEIHDAWFSLAVVSPDGRRRDVPRVRELSGRLSDIVTDEGTGFWLGTALGLAHYLPLAWRTPPALLPFKGPASAILQSRRGDLFILNDATLLHRRDGAWRAFAIPGGREASLVRPHALAELPNGEIVFGGTPTPAVRFDPDRGTFAPFRHATVGVWPEVLGASSRGGVWLLTIAMNEHRRIEHYDGERFEPRVEGRPEWGAMGPRMVVETADGRVVAVPDGSGVGEWNAGRYRTLTAADGLPMSHPFAALEVTPGVLWLGGRDEVVQLRQGQWSLVRRGLQTVRSLSKTRDGAIWVAAGSGLHRFKDGAWLDMGAPEGVPNGSAYRIFEEHDGTMWVSTTLGVARLDARADREPPDTRILADENLADAAPDGAFRVVFRGVDPWRTTPAERLLFSWRVDGGAWTPFVSEPSALLNGLTHGRHVVEVRAMDRAGNIDPTPARFAFRVLLPWYREAGFLAVGLAGLAALGALVGLVISRHRRLERLVAARTDELASANRELQARLDEQRRLEGERAQLEAQLHQSQKLEAIGRLAGGVAHDFNNLLSVIGSYSELLLEDLPAGDSARASVEEIARASDRATALTRQLLAFSRHQAVRAQPLDIDGVVCDIERMLRRLIGENIDLQVDRGRDLWPVLADRSQIEQVLLNLATNARDAMPDGGVLRLRTANVELGAEFVRTHVGATRGPHVLIEVEDSGIGMDATTASRIFEPFFTTKTSGKGSGLGLATVYGIVGRASGYIEVESQPGVGTTFRIYLPRTEATPETSVAPPVAARAGGHERVLVIEDEDAVRSLAASVLRKSGYDVVDVSSAEAAQALFGDPGFVVDLVLSDIVLKGMSGPQFAAELARARPGVRVLFMSGYADDTVLRHGPVDLNNAFIQKPFTPERLTRKVRDVLDGVSAG